MSNRLSIRLQRPRNWVATTAIAATTALGVWYCVKPPAQDAGKAVGLFAIDQSAQPDIIPAPLPSPFPTRLIAQIPATTAHTPRVSTPVATVAKPQVTPVPRRDAAPLPTFNGKKLVKVKTLHMLVTAYSPDRKSCGKWADGITASGYSVWTNGMKLVAADTRLLPFGTLVSIPGYNHGKPVPVLDRGGKIKGRHLDVLYPTDHMATRWGVKHLDVTIYQYANQN